MKCARARAAHFHPTDRPVRCCSGRSVPDFFANIVVCCGDAEFVSNGDLEYDVAFEYEDGLFIQEVTHEATLQLVWQMSVAGQLIYRGFPVPSMYPGGRKWMQTAIAAAKINATPTPARKPVIKKPVLWPIS